MRLSLRIPTLILAVAAAAFCQQPTRPAPAPTQGERDDAALREIRAARGVDHWAQNDVLMGLTRPPSSPVRPVAEWEKAGAVLFAVDSDILASLVMNRRVRTTGSAAGVYSHAPEVTEALNAFFCNSADADSGDDDEDAAGDDDAALQSVIRQMLREEQQGCSEGELQPEVLARRFDQLAIAHDFLETVSGLSGYVDVILTVRPQGLDGLGVSQIADSIRAFATGKKVLDAPHIFLVEAPFDSKWIRDYGPFFVRDSKGQLLTVDTRYPESTTQNSEIREVVRAIQKASDAKGRKAEDGNEVSEEGRTHDDQFPSVFAAQLRERVGGKLQPHPLSVVRPPVALSGGDFLTDGQGTVFTSTETLRENGGDVDLLDLNFEKYMGAQRVVYLHPLPGETVKHIDMFFQVAAPNVLLLGKFARLDNASPEARLQSAARAAMEDNLEIIRSHYEKLGKIVKVIDDDAISIDPRAINIVRIPMPDVLRPVYEKIEAAIRQYKAAELDYDVHSRLLRLVARLDSDLSDLDGTVSALPELASEAGQKHPADIHDLEVLSLLLESGSDAAKDAAQYAALSGEHQGEKDSIRAVAAELASVAGRLRDQVLAAEEDQPLDAKLLDGVISASQGLLRAAQEFRRAVQGDEAKDSDLAKGTERPMRAAEQALKKVLNDYQYGTDLYRTYLNLLQVRTGGGFVLVFPSYRDDAVKSSGETALRRVRAVFGQLYGPVSLVNAPSDTFITQLGSVHCLTKVLPEGVDFPRSVWNHAAPEKQP